MSSGNKEIQGSVSVSRHVSVGSSAHVNGDVSVGHNLFVEGSIESKGVMMTCKGMFRSVESLKEAYPDPETGWWGLVGTSLPAQVYVAESGHWVGTGGTSGVILVYRDILDSPDDDVRVMERDEAVAMVDKYFNY